jgi:hypothetical protein
VRDFIAGEQLTIRRATDLALVQPQRRVRFEMGVGSVGYEAIPDG